MGRDRSQKAALSESFPELAKGSLGSQDNSRHHSQRRQVLADNFLTFPSKKGTPQSPLSLRSALSAAKALRATSPRHTPLGGHHRRGDAQKDVSQHLAGTREVPVPSSPRLSTLSGSSLHLPNCGQVEGMMEEVVALRGPEQPGGQCGEERSRSRSHCQCQCPCRERNARAVLAVIPPPRGRPRLPPTPIGLYPTLPAVFWACSNRESQWVVFSKRRRCWIEPGL